LNLETHYVDCKTANIPGTLKGMREVLDGWLALGTANSTLVILDDLHSVVKTETEVRMFATSPFERKLMGRMLCSKMIIRILERLQSTLCMSFVNWLDEAYLYS
jgi:hypothetical protein